MEISSLIDMNRSTCAINKLVRTGSGSDRASISTMTRSLSQAISDWLVVGVSSLHSSQVRKGGLPPLLVGEDKLLKKISGGKPPFPT